MDESDREYDYSTEESDSSGEEDIVDSSDEESGSEHVELQSNLWFRVYPPENREDLPYEFDEPTGPRSVPHPTSKPVEYFYLFFTLTFWNEIVKYTNDYATHFKETNSDLLKENSLVHSWVATNIVEMKAFIAIIINMGLNKKSTLASFWSTTESQSMPWFGMIMPRNRFELLLKFFHLTRTNLPRPNQAGYDPCSRFQPIIDQLNVVSQQHYVPSQQLSIDESLVGTKNKTQLMQYLPNKHHHKWGIKLWMLCESATAYVLSCFVYKGKRDQQPRDGRGLAHRVVVTLLTMGNYLRKGYHVFIDNFFSSISLAKELWNSKTYVTGTVRQNSKGLPRSIKNKLKPSESSFFRQDNILVSAYREKQTQKKPVILLSTASNATLSSVEVRQRGQGDAPLTREKPDVVLEYNKYMGGVDLSDMMLYAYLDERRTVKYWKKVTFNILHRMIVNAYIIYKQNIPADKKPMTRHKFTVGIVNDLVEEHKANRNRPTPSKGPVGVSIIEENKEKDCCVCSDRKTPGGRKRSRTMCNKCLKGLHGPCMSKHKCKK